MLSEEKIVEVLEAYDLTRSYRSAALLAGVDHHTVRRYVAARDSGLDLTVTPVERQRVSDPFADKILEWIDRSQGRVRADVVHERLVAMGYEGSERTTRRVVSALKVEWQNDHRRVFKPWIPEPGLWLQWDYGAGPSVAGVRVVLFCAWLAWSRFRVIIPLADKTLPSVISALDRCFRIIGGVPTYALTDNEKTVTDGHVAGIAIRNPQIVAVSYYYGVKIVTCVPADPQSKGGSEATVRIAKADLVPTQANLRDGYDSWDELEEACEAAMAKFNGRPHALTGDKPADRLGREVGLLHAVPVEPYTATFGETRAVTWSSLIHFRGARYSVPHAFMGQRVWVRVAAQGR
jgi:transposase